MMDGINEAAAEKIRNHRLIVFIITSIVISILLVMVGLALYNSSGTAQLDLSRPGLADLRTKVVNDDSYPGFPNVGPLDKKALDEFAGEYDKELKDAQSVDAFTPDVLSPKSLQMDK